jgi:hypothetical protein
VGIDRRGGKSKGGGEAMSGNAVAIDYPYPDYIMEYVRQNLGLDANDTSRDVEIVRMSRDEILNRVCTWNGLIDYGATIKEWVGNIFEVELEG